MTKVEGAGAHTSDDQETASFDERTMLASSRATCASDDTPRGDPDFEAILGPSVVSGGQETQV